MRMTFHPADLVALRLDYTVITDPEPGSDVVILLQRIGNELNTEINL